LKIVSCTWQATYLALALWSGRSGTNIPMSGCLGYSTLLLGLKHEMFSLLEHSVIVYGLLSLGTSSTSYANAL